MRLFFGMIACLVVLASFGCGGGGSSESSGSVSIFATDDLNTGYDHVWVTIKEIKLISDSGLTTVFSDPEGQIVDLRSLHDDFGERFLYLSSKSVGSGPYTGVQVTLSKDLILYTTGASTGTPAVFSGAGATDVVLQFSFSAPQNLPSGEHVVIDFDLANWTEAGGVVSASGGAFIKEGDDSLIHDEDRHEAEDYHGVVANLSGSAPAQTFRLSNDGFDVLVKTNADTVIFNSDATPSPSLENGKRVEVRGQYSTAESAIIASQIKIEDEDDEDEDAAKGAPSAISGDEFDLEVAEVEGFIPEQSKIHVVVDSTAKYFTDNGVMITKTEFFDALASATEVEVEGTYVSGSNMLTATKLKLEDEDEEHEAEITGQVSNIDVLADPKTFDIKVKSWEGINVGLDQVINVVVAEGAEFIDSGDMLTEEQFFALLSAGQLAEIKGDYDAETNLFSATRLDLED